ncbi:CCA tRNA nucleotidyltransferase, mitochondrial [Actinomortierella ambigua]|uniref:CCA tRNA nucleotidyltransferase, mitochondrial n=1 Tax=Actinomortierella ambigua TaxID=1343610 RepID=A0A9P6Q6A3_9FUNG|nr:CCA tRNA nucleotidyltransferase, mitochondrial [Actinomortierella ambigua]
MSTNLTSKENLTPGGNRGEMRIRLTDQEAAICDVLDKVSKYVESTTGTKVQLRVAGGWVRDKASIDSMMGYDFAVHVNEYMAQQGHEKRTVARIATNPEKSKHLETATMVVHGIPLDFVNLRSEVYDDASRIPSEITYGTPFEDAERRDITINALFYNIHTHQVEDFTGKGLDDLKEGLIRTPLESFETFWQDPLRVMRVIRFAARYQFTLVPEVRQAILDERIKQVLKTKISKERIGTELEKMIDDQAGRSTAIRLLNELSLYDVVFASPVIDDSKKGTSEVKGPIHNTDDAFKLVWILEWLLRINPAPATTNTDSGVPERGVYQAEIDLGQEAVLEQAHQMPDKTGHLYAVVRSVTPAHSPLIPQTVIKEDVDPEKLATRNLILAGMLYPYRDMMTTVNKKPMAASAWIMRYGLKGRNVDIDIVTKLMESISTVQEIVNRPTPATPVMMATETPSTSSAITPEEEHRRRIERAEMGVVIRDIGFSPIIGKKWQAAFLLALAVELIPKFEVLKGGVLDNDTAVLLKKYNDFLVAAHRYEIDHCFGWKYLVDGKDLTLLLNIRAGPKVTGFLRKVMYWQLMYPHGSKQQCQEWILQNSELFQ